MALPSMLSRAGSHVSLRATGRLLGLHHSTLGSSLVNIVNTEPCLSQGPGPGPPPAEFCGHAGWHWPRMQAASSVCRHWGQLAQLQRAGLPIGPYVQQPPARRGQSCSFDY